MTTDKESPRCVRILCGGADNTEDVSATGRVRAFITQVKERNKLNPDDFYFLKSYHIHNLTIEVLKESGATKLLDSLKLPKDLYCPSALYKFMLKMHGKTPPPKPPKHERVQAYADKGLMKKLDELEIPQDTLVIVDGDEKNDAMLINRSTILIYSLRSMHFISFLKVCNAIYFMPVCELDEILD